MFAAKASRLLPQTQKIAQQGRNMSVLSGPPTVKITPVEKLVHGIFISVGCMVIPAWVLVNIKNYRAPKD